ncbi:MAG: MFS transporter [Alphaproteobacteria bacterium]|nr:MFS transporter [Alphaproteobacteria bacterium]
MEARASGTDAAPVVDVGSLIDQGPWPVWAKIYVFMAALAVLLDGYDNQVLGFALPAMIAEWHAARSLFSPVLAIGLVGVGVGAGLGGLVGDRIGRKAALIGSAVLFALATGAVAWVHDISPLLILRLLAGIGIGGVFPNAAALAAEFSPQRNRPMAVALTIVCVPLGGMIGGLIAAMVLPALGWRALFVLGGTAPLALAAVLLWTLPESPRFMARRPERFADLIKLLSRFGHPLPPHTRFIDRTEVSDSGKPALLAIFSPFYLRDTLILWGAFFFNLFAVYSVFNWAPALMTSMGLDLANASRTVAAYNFGAVIGAIACAWLIGKFGSRISMVLMTLLAAGCAAVLSVLSQGHPNVQDLTIWMALHGLFTNGAQTTLYSLSAHIYKADVRTTGAGTALAIGRIGAIVGSYGGAALVDAGGSRYFAALTVALIGTATCLAFIRRHIPRA